MATCFSCKKALNGSWNMTTSGAHGTTGRYLGIQDGYFLYGVNPNWVWCYCKSCWDVEVLKLPFVAQTVNQLAPLQQQLNTSQQQLTALQQQHTTLQQEKTSLQQQLNTSQQQLSTSQQQLNNSQQQLTALQQQLNNSQQQLTSLKQEKVLLEQKYNTIEKVENFKQESKYTQLQDIVNSLNEDEIQSLESCGLQPITSSFEEENKKMYKNFTKTTTTTIIQQISSIVQNLQQEHEHVTKAITSAKQAWAGLNLKGDLVVAAMAPLEQNLTEISQKIQKWEALKQKLQEILQS